MPSQIQVTHGIEHLVFDELILVTQPSVIENTVIVNHDRIINASASGKTTRTHILKFMHEPERSCATDFADEGLSTNIESSCARLLLENRVIKSIPNVTLKPL